MYLLRLGWSPIVITALALAGYMYEWQIEILAAVLIIILVIGLTVLFSLIAVLVTGGSLAYVKELIKAGSASLAPFIDNAKKYFLRLLAVTVIILLALAVIGVLLSLILGFLPVALRVILMILIFLALIVFVIMCPYALVGSELGIVEAVKKGILMAKKNFLNILGIIAIMFGVAVLIMIAASIVTGILSFILRPISGFITAVVMAAANAVTVVLVNIAYMDFYLKNASSEGTQSTQS